jgi:hypothetical protein
MQRNIWKYGRVLLAAVALVAVAAGGTADARGGVGRSVDGTEVEDGTLTAADVQDGSLTGADIDQSTLKCGGPGGIPGCGAAAPAPAAPAPGPSGSAALTTTFGTSATAQIGYPAIKTALLKSDCPTGTKAVGGSVSWDNDQNDDDVYFRESGFTGPNSWYAIAVDGPVNNHPITARVTAICIS